MYSGDSPAESVSIGLVQQIAQEDGVDPCELTPPLTDVIDSDALDRLIVSMDGETDKVVFTYRGYRITVHHTGDVTLQQPHKQ